LINSIAGPGSRSLTRTLLYCFVTASSLGIAFGETVQRNPLANEPLERASDAPMFIWRTGASEPMISQHGAFTSYQVNVDSNGQNITGDAAVQFQKGWSQGMKDAAKEHGPESTMQ